MASENPRYIAVDWGTSNLRAFLIAHTGRVIATKSSEQGMKTLRQDEFEGALVSLVSDWEADSLPILIAGMAGARGGWQEVPYQTLPLNLFDLASHCYAVTCEQRQSVYIVPGLKGIGLSEYPDVMRGEEVQLLGVDQLLTEQGHSRWAFCMPGTHCKWGRVESGMLSSFSTTMTGELFELLATHSSLSSPSQGAGEFCQQAFIEGVGLAKQKGDLLHHLFSCRSRVVTNQMPSQQVRSYLSGMLIGSDCAAMVKDLMVSEDKLCLIGDPGLSQRYQDALALFGIKADLLEASQASVAGLNLIANQLFTRQGERLCC